MPGGDRTGPSGMGPNTGRGAGYCTGNPTVGFGNGGWGRGRRGGNRGGGWNQGDGWGRGGGWGHRHGYYATGQPGWQRAATWEPAYAPPYPGPYGSVMTREQELDALKSQSEHVEQVLDDLKRRIEELSLSAQDAKTK